MKNKDKLSAKRHFYGKYTVVLLVLVSIGIWFINKTEKEQLIIDQEPIVSTEEPMQEEIPALEKESNDEKAVVSYSSIKKKVTTPKSKKIKVDEVLLTAITEDTLTNIDEKEDTTKRAIENVTRSQIFACGGWGPRIPLLKIFPANEPEKNRRPETILKDVENLTRNGNYTYIVDGVRVSEETFRSLNQNDVESVDIYKYTDVYNARFGNKDNQSRISLNAR
ncbi:hypothetical protein NU10_10235 [Flavobacterium dauae]|uniref:hypothetical protein n=1 Tax=Flavobacterium dauae TaxID=1563479 RepID=UPI00101B415A|nr:hypothetical protein [Flavobacterium dauae]WLD23083.1 hypothetical protein NU10_10235 [Flavobacterium dauae]